MSKPREERKAHFQGSVSCAICEAGQIKLVPALFCGRVGPQVPLYFFLMWPSCSLKLNLGAPKTIQILSFKSHSSSINYWPSALIRWTSLARSLPEPQFTLALSAGVIIPTNCRLDVLGQWGHSIAPTTLFSGNHFTAARREDSGAPKRSSAVNIWGIIKVFQELTWFMEQLTPWEGTEYLGLDKRVSEGPLSWPVTHIE